MVGRRGLLEVDVWRKMIAHCEAMIARTEANMRTWLEEIAKRQKQAKTRPAKKGLKRDAKKRLVKKYEKRVIKMRPSKRV